MAERIPPSLDEIRRLEDPVARLKAARARRTDAIRAHHEELAALTAVIVGAIDEAKARGITQAKIAEQLGVSRQRLWQIAKGLN